MSKQALRRMCAVFTLLVLAIFSAGCSQEAPKEETAVHTLVDEYRRRLKPDPVAIGLWLLTLCVFCLLTYLFVIR